jgi:hypothetical protein
MLEYGILLLRFHKGNISTFAQALEIKYNGERMSFGIIGCRHQDKLGKIPVENS